MTEVVSQSAPPILEIDDSTSDDSEVCEIIDASTSTASSANSSPANSSPDEEMDTSTPLTPTSAQRKRTISALNPFQERPKRVRSMTVEDNIPEGNKCMTMMKQREQAKKCFAHLFASSVDGKPELTMINILNVRMNKMHEDMQKAIDTSKKYKTITAIQLDLEETKNKNAYMAEQLSDLTKKFEALEAKYKNAIPSLSKPAGHMLANNRLARHETQVFGPRERNALARQAEQSRNFAQVVVPIVQNGEIIAVGHQRPRLALTNSPHNSPRRNNQRRESVQSIGPPSVPQSPQRPQQSSQQRPQQIVQQRPSQSVQPSPNNMQVAIPTPRAVVPPHRRMHQEGMARLDQHNRHLQLGQHIRQQALNARHWQMAAAAEIQQRQHIRQRQQPPPPSSVVIVEQVDDDIGIVNVVQNADKEPGPRIFGNEINGGRPAGHVKKIEPAADGFFYIHDGSEKNCEGVVKEILVYIPLIIYERLTSFDVNRPPRIPEALGSNPSRNVQLTLRTTFEDFYSAFQICGNIVYDKLDDVQNKEIQLLVEVLSMKKKGLYGKLASNERCRWGTSSVHECNPDPRNKRIKFKVKYHRDQDVALGDRISVLAVITDKITKRIEVSNVAALLLEHIGGP